MTWARVFDNPLERGTLSEAELWEQALSDSRSKRLDAVILLKKHFGYTTHDVVDGNRSRLVLCKPGAWRKAKKYVREHPDSDLIFWAGEFGCTVVI